MSQENYTVAGFGLALAMTVMPLPAQAQMDLQRYEELVATGKQIAVDLYLEGVLEGFYWAEVDDESEKPRKFFCLPPRRDLYDFQHIRDAVKSELVARADFWRKEPNVSLAQIAFEALRRQYPCR